MQTRVTFCRCLVVAAIVIALAAPVFSQTAPDNSSRDSGKKDDVSTLKQQVAEQQKEIEQLRSIVNQMKQKLDQTPEAATAKVAPAAAAPAPTAPAPAPAQTAVVSRPNLGEVASTTPILPRAAKSSASGDATMIGSTPAPPPRYIRRRRSTSKSGPGLTASISYRQRFDNSRGVHGFHGCISHPCGGRKHRHQFRQHTLRHTASYQNNLTEFRLSIQNSRIGFRADADVKGAHVIGYMEADFLGNNPANVAVSSNSNTMRSRLYWVDVARGKLGNPGRPNLEPAHSGPQKAFHRFRVISFTPRIST